MIKINASYFQSNIQKLLALASEKAAHVHCSHPPDFLVVAKANAYGHGLLALSKHAMEAGA